MEFITILSANLAGLEQAPLVALAILLGTLVGAQLLSAFGASMGAR